jgi:uncharacterized protein
MDKMIEILRYTTFTIVFILVSCTNVTNKKAVNSDKLLERNGVYYFINETKPFNGFAADSILGIRTALLEFKNGLLSGTSEEYYRSGQIEVKGEFKDGIRSGDWIEYFENGQVKSEGEFKDGIRSGDWIEYFENSQIYSQGSYVNGLKQGEWKEYNEDGFLYEQADYSSGFLNGQYYRFSSMSGDTIINGNFTINNVNTLELNKFQNITLDDFRLSVGDNDLLSPDLRELLKTDIKNILFYSGVIDTSGVGDFSVERLEEGNFQEVGYFSFNENGLNGLYKDSKVNGQLIEMGEYRDGVPFGEWKYYNEIGKISELITFNILGQKDGLYKRYDGRGNLINEYWYSKDVKNGPFKKYYSNSSLESEGEYKNGLKHGKWRYYHRKTGPGPSILRRIEVLTNGLFTGTNQQFDDKGILVEEEIHEKSRYELIRYQNGTVKLFREYVSKRNERRKT